MRKDLHLTLDGDIMLGSDGDFLVSLGDDCIVDQIAFRLKTSIGDYLLLPLMGSNLESLAGQLNTRELGTQAEELVRRALTHDNFLHPSEIRTLRCVPTATHEVTVFLTVLGEEGALDFTIPIDLRAGKVDIQF